MSDETQSNVKPQWKHAPEELVTFFLDVARKMPGAETRKMFGYPCSFANGQMFTGLFQDKMFVRLSEEDRAIFQAIEGVQALEPMPGRPMREYCVIPERILKNASELEFWLQKSLAYAISLPPKVKKKKAKK